MIDPYLDKTVRNLEKARGQLDAVLAMAKNGRYCMDIVQQNNALIGILRQVNNLILESHLHTCGARLNSKNMEEKENFIKEILRACNVSQRKI